MESFTHRIQIIDSHTGGEPTRVVVDGGPQLGDGPLRERLENFRNQFDRFRSAIVNEPRGSDAVVGALLCKPFDPTCAAGVIFFNNVGYLGMCGHGTIGLAVTLGYLGKIQCGTHRIDTPVGVVEAELHDSHSVTVNNVPSYREAAGIHVKVDGFGEVHGDIAWGGNWFFLTENCPFPLELSALNDLTRYAWKVREALTREGFTGRNGQEIDHIELIGPAKSAEANSRNFVLCPGGSYDRSPCGTGTSAKLACLYADGKIDEGTIWRQESILGSVFEGQVRIEDQSVLPRITGTAYVNAEASLLLDANDRFAWGIRG